MGLTFRQLEIFEKVATTEHITKASEMLFMSQSAVSMAISELEKEIGCPLFERRGKRLVLNEKGRLLLLQTQKIVKLINTTLEMVQEGEMLSGILKVGASTTIGNYLLPVLIGSFMAKFPSAQILLQVGNTHQIEMGVESGELDLGLIEGPSHFHSLNCVPWREDELVVFVGPDHPWTKVRKVTPSMLQSANWIVREKGSGTREIFETSVARKLKTLNIGLELGHTEAIKKAVEAGLGVSCLSRLAIQRELMQKWLIEIKTPLDLKRPLSIVIHQEKYQTNMFHTFVDFLLANSD